MKTDEWLDQPLTQWVRALVQARKDGLSDAELELLVKLARTEPAEGEAPWLNRRT